MVAFNYIREFNFILRNNIFFIRDLSELLRIDPKAQYGICLSLATLATNLSVTFLQVF